MRFSLALTGLAAVAVNASCKGRSAASVAAAAATDSVAASASDAAAAPSTPASAYSNSTSPAAASSSGSIKASTSTSSAASSSTSVSGTVKAASTGTVSAANSGIKGFNYGAFFLNQQALDQTDFEAEFNRAKDMPNTDGWTSARLYTMIQWGTTSDVITAIPAAIATNTTLLLGLWISGGDQAIANEIAALESAISTYGTAFTDLVVGISVGSEDLYRDSDGEVGTTAAYLIDCITQVRSTISGTDLADTPVGHVDTYDAFLNSTNTAVIEYIDWIGFDGYPYWESALPNSIDDAATRFYDGFNKTLALANGKPVYVTETGWPVTGDTENEAVASAENARQYWETIACTLISSGVNLWWYTLQESQYGTADPDFGIYGAGDLATLSPQYDLSCP